MRDVEQALERPAETIGESALPYLGGCFPMLGDQLASQPETTRELIRLLKLVRSSPGVGRVVFERAVLDGLSGSALHACASVYDESIFPKPLATNPETIPSERREGFVVLQELCLFAMDCLLFSRPRDSFSGERRRLAFELVSNAVDVVEPPDEFFDHVKKALNKASNKTRNQEVIGALLFCEEYYSRAGGVPDEIVHLLYGVVEKTSSRGIATGALNVLVESGDMDELDAIDRLYDWKDRNNCFL